MSLDTNTPTRFIAAYDTERATCLDACRAIREVHEFENQFPATFFVVGQRLHEDSIGYKNVLDAPYFEIGSHTWNHMVLKEHPLKPGWVPSSQERREQIHRGVEIVSQTFQRPCYGFRPAYGFSDGLLGDPKLIDLMLEAGVRYTSSMLWGPDTTLPARFVPPFVYPGGLIELPAHGDHENVLKIADPRYETIRTERLRDLPFVKRRHTLLENPEQEFEIYRQWIDEAVRTRQPYISFIWHPWSLHVFDPKLIMLQRTFAYAKERGLIPSTFYEESMRHCAF